MSVSAETLRREGSGFLRFCVVGVFGLAVDGGALLALIQHAGLDPYTARILSIAFAVSVTWAAHRLWTFGTLGSARLSEWARYQLTSAFGAFVNFAIYSLLIAGLGIGPLLSMAIASVIALGVNFAGARLFAFTGHSFSPS